MQVFVTGGTGFVGSEVVRQLTAGGHHVVALVRRGSAEKLPKVENVKIHVGDVTDPESLSDGVQGCDAVIPPGRHHSRLPRPWCDFRTPVFRGHTERSNCRCVGRRQEVSAHERERSASRQQDL